MLSGFALLLLLIRLKAKKEQKQSLIMSIAFCVLAYVGYIFLANEILSLFKAISTASLIITWGTFDLFVIAAIVARLRKNKLKLSEHLKEEMALVREERVFVALFGLLSLVMIVIAVRCIPNNWDSLSYHLPRIIFWLKQGSINHFATNDTRMLGTPPLKEFVDLHVYGLAGKYYDPLLNLTQTFSYLFNILFVFEVSKEAGCRKRTSVIAALLFASAPIAIAEALSTQTDQFAAMFVLVFVLFVMRIRKKINKLTISKKTLGLMGLLGVLVAFVYLSKPTGVFVVAVFAIYLLVSAVKEKKKISFLVFCVAGVTVATGIVASPELIRNEITYGSVMDPWQGPGQLATTIDPRYLVVNLLKNIGTNLVHTAWPRSLLVWEKGVYKVAEKLAVDADDLNISEHGNPYKLNTNSWYEYSSDTASNPLQIIAVIGFILLGIVIRIKSKKKSFTEYSICAFCSFFLALAFIKWEPCMTRYMVCNYAVAMPAVAIMAEKCFSAKNEKLIRAALAMLGVMVLGAGVDFAIHETVYNPIEVGPWEYTYMDGQGLLALEERLKEEQFGNVGYDLYNSGSDSYPVLHLLDRHSERLWMVNVQNDTKKYENTEKLPEIIVVGCASEIFDTCPENLDSYKYLGQEYTDIEKISSDVHIVWLKQR